MWMIIALLQSLQSPNMNPTPQFSSRTAFLTFMQNDLSSRTWCDGYQWCAHILGRLAHLPPSMSSHMIFAIFHRRPQKTQKKQPKFFKIFRFLCGFHPKRSHFSNFVHHLCFIFFYFWFFGVNLVFGYLEWKFAFNCLFSKFWKKIAMKYPGGLHRNENPKSTKMSQKSVFLFLFLKNSQNQPFYAIIPTFVVWNHSNVWSPCCPSGGKRLK